MSLIITVSISNLIGIALILMLFICNRESFLYDRNMRSPAVISLLIGITCLAEMFSYILDGRPGFISHAIIYILNTWIYFSSPLVCYIWLNFVGDHIRHPLSARLRKLNYLVLAVSAAILLVNLFVPVIFTVEGDFYSRCSYFQIYNIIAFYFCAVAIIKYNIARKKVGALVYFPVAIFVIPIAVAVAVQTCFYGVSVIWVGAAVAVTGMVFSLKNELIYIDQLTGVNNRYYLEEAKKIISKKNSHSFTGMMLDLNDFKSINDTYGHAVGDEALIAASEIFVAALEMRGKVIRYAGDEFVILITSTEDAVIEDIINKINTGFAEFNKSSRYQLSASLGYHKFNLSGQPEDDFLNIIDAKMYENKVEYYRTHKKSV